MNKISDESFVYEKNKKLIKLKYVNVGDEILCENGYEDNYTKVNKKYEFVSDFYKEVKFYNGSILRVLDIDSNKFMITPCNKDLIYSYDEKLSDTAWFLGMHTGDGTCDRKFVNNKKSQYYKYRIRILGDNENCIRKYNIFLNNYVGSNVKYKNIGKIWSLSVNGKYVIKIIDELFDGKFGNKTYDGDVYSYIENNNLWVPFISGLIDADGYIKLPGHARLDMCMTKVIDKILCILSVCGVRYHHTYVTNVGRNETPIHSVYIYGHNDICSHINKYLNHDVKYLKLLNRKISYKSRSKYILDDNFLNSIKIDNNFSKYTKQQIYDAKTYNELGLGGLYNLLEYNSITNQEFFRIIRNNNIFSVSLIKKPINFISLETDVGNYYTGNFGLVNIKC